MSRKPHYFLIAGLVLFAVLTLPLRNTLVDDTYIHLVYARNLADVGEFSFNRGDPTYGSTSPLWVGLLAAVHFLKGDMIVWCRVLSWIFALCSIAFLYRIACRIDERVALSGALVLSAEAWFLRWSAVGMETSFAVFMVLLALDAAFSARESNRRSALFGFLLLLAILARPESALLVPIAFFVFLPTRRRGGGVNLTWLLVFIPLYAAWLILIKHHTGTFLPLTAGAKQGRPDISLAVFRRALVPIKIVGATLALPALAMLAGIILGIRKGGLLRYFTDDERLRDGVLMIMLWAIALPAVYVVLDFQVLSRYLLPVTPAIVLLGMAGWSRIARGLFPGPLARRIALVAFTLLVIIQSVLFYAVVVVPPTVEFSAGLTDVLAGMGGWLERNAEEDALVATPDIGAIGYFSRRRILDLGGLITPEINDMRQRIDVESIIEQGMYLRFDPDFLVDRSERPERFSGSEMGGVLFTPVMGGTVANLGIRKPFPVRYVLYRLERVER